MMSLSKYPYFALDTETTGLQYKKDKVFGFSIATPDKKAGWWDLRKKPNALRWLAEELKNYKGTIIFANASFDTRMLDFVGVSLPIHQADDVIIRASCINEHLFDYSLDGLSKKYLGRGKIKGVDRSALEDENPEKVKEYATEDAILTLLLWEWQEKEIERQQIWKVCNFERTRMPSFIKSEMRGIPVDVNYAERAMDLLTPEINEIQNRIGINVNSPPQVRALFNPREISDGVWVTESGEPLGTTGKGLPSVGAEFLRAMDDPRAQDIIELRSLLKTRDTFLKKHVIEHAIDGRVYPTVNQTKNESHGTGTGRLSMSDPAMQQIPSRNKKIAAIVKPCFLPEEGQVWVSADMASFEVRVFAHLVNNPEILQAYEVDPETDFHNLVSELTGLVRNATYSGEPNAKQLNLSMIFNSGDGAIAAKMGMPYEWASFDTTENGKPKTVTYRKPGPEAKEVIARYHQRLPGIKKLAERCEELAKKTGYVFTYTGRRLRFPRGYRTYKASGILIQATAADLNKENWGIIDEELDGVGHMIVNTHDDYNMSLPEGDWEPHFRRVKARIEEKGRLRVPLILEHSGTGVNWWNALSNES